MQAWAVDATRSRRIWSIGRLSPARLAALAGVSYAAGSSDSVNRQVVPRHVCRSVRIAVTDHLALGQSLPVPALHPVRVDGDGQLRDLFDELAGGQCRRAG